MSGRLSGKTLVQWMQWHMSVHGMSALQHLHLFELQLPFLQLHFTSWAREEGAGGVFIQSTDKDGWSTSMSIFQPWPTGDGADMMGVRQRRQTAAWKFALWACKARQSAFGGRVWSDLHVSLKMFSRASFTELVVFWPYSLQTYSSRLWSCCGVIFQSSLKCAKVSTYFGDWSMVCNGFILPLPFRALVLSHPINAWNPTRDSQTARPNFSSSGLTKCNLELFPHPVEKYSGQDILFALPTHSKNTSVSGLLMVIPGQ